MNWTIIMDHTYWLKQTNIKPIYENLLWSRPENRLNAGKLLIIGGNHHNFIIPADAYQIALENGIGQVKVILPQSLQKLISHYFHEAEYVKSTPSGSFAKEALETILQYCNWSDGSLLAGDTGYNSETAILLQELLTHFHGRLTITNDCLDNLILMPEIILSRQNTLVVSSFSQLQKIATKLHLPKAFTSSMSLMQIVEQLYDLSLSYPLAGLIIAHQDTLIVAFNGQISSTPNKCKTPIKLLTNIATIASILWIQNNDCLFEAATTALYVLNNS